MGFRERHPDIWAGLLEPAQELPRNNFPWRIRGIVLRGDEPTPNQVGACYRNLKIKSVAKKKPRPGRHAAGAAPRLYAIEHAMSKDLAELRMGDYRFVWADGTILVRFGGEYVGKIRTGAFTRAPNCTDNNAREIKHLAKHPGG